MRLRRNVMSNDRGFTITELMIVVVLVALLTSIAVPMYREHIVKARVTKAIGDISSLSLQIEQFRLRNGDRVPDSLAELGVDIPQDPWGQAYGFLNIRTAANPAAVRKDGRLIPLNTDYDLFSIGADGRSAPPLSAAQARDDVLRANDGAFIGLGKDY